jgi:hypothetical protein
LEGHWRGTTVEGVAPEALPNALAFGKAVEWEVAGDQLVVLSPLGRQVGKFSVEGDNGGVLTIRTDLDGATTRETLTFLNDKSFRWTVNESKGLAIVFLRD